MNDFIENEGEYLVYAEIDFKNRGILHIIPPEIKSEVETIALGYDISIRRYDNCNYKISACERDFIYLCNSEGNPLGKIMWPWDKPDPDFFSEELSAYDLLIEHHLYHDQVITDIVTDKWAVEAINYLLDLYTDPQFLHKNRIEPLLCEFISLLPTESQNYTHEIVECFARHTQTPSALLSELLPKATGNAKHLIEHHPSFEKPLTEGQIVKPLLTLNDYLWMPEFANAVDQMLSRKDLPAPYLIERSDDVQVVIRARVAEHPAAPPELLQYLSRDPKLMVLKRVAAHANSPEEVLKRLSKHPDEDVRAAIASNAACPADVLRAMENDVSLRVLQRLVDNPALTQWDEESADGLKRLNAWDKKQKTLSDILHSPKNESQKVSKSTSTDNASPQDHFQIADYNNQAASDLNTDNRHLEDIALDPQTPVKILMNLAINLSAAVRLGVAANWDVNYPASLLEDLAHDPNPLVRRTILGHPSWPLEALEAITIANAHSETHAVEQPYTSDERVKLGLLAQKYGLSLAHQQQFMGSGSLYVQLCLAEQLTLDPVIIDNMSQSKYAPLRWAIADHPAISLVNLAFLASDTNENVKFSALEQLSMRLSTFPVTVEELADMRFAASPEVLLSLAQLPKLPAYVIDALASGASSELALALINHPQTHSSTRLRLLALLGMPELLLRSPTTSEAVLLMLTDAQFQHIHSHVATHPNATETVRRSLSGELKDLHTPTPQGHPTVQAVSRSLKDYFRAWKKDQ